MRRITDIGMHCKRQMICEDKQTGGVLRVPADVLYMMSRYERRLQGFCRSTGVNEAVPVHAPWKMSYERKVVYDCKTVFDVDLCPFVNLSSLCIRNTCYFDVYSINGSMIRVLEMENISKVDVTRMPCMDLLEEIKMKGCTISYASLECILSIGTLVSVSLDGVVVSEEAASRNGFCSHGVGMYSDMLMRMVEQMPRLKRIELVNMEVDIERVVSGCVMSDVTWFKVRSKDVHVEVAFCAFASRIRCLNGMKYLSGIELCEAEAMCVEGSDIKHLSEMSVPRVSFLSVRNAEIDGRLARTMCTKYSKLVRIEFIGCRFEGTVFYEISTHFRNCLRYLNLMKSDLPHDYMCFLGGILRHCVVRLKNGEQVVVRRKESGD